MSYKINLTVLLSFLWIVSCGTSEPTYPINPANFVYKGSCTLRAEGSRCTEYHGKMDAKLIQELCKKNKEKFVADRCSMEGVVYGCHINFEGFTETTYYYSDGNSAYKKESGISSCKSKKTGLK